MLLKIGVVLCVLALGNNGNPLKVSSALESSLRSNGTVNVFLTLESPQQLLNQLKSAKYSSRAERKTVVANGLKAFAKGSQAKVLEYLTSSGVTAKGFWITNQVYVKNADTTLIRKLAQRFDIVSIDEELTGDKLIPSIAKPSSRTTAVEWGLEMIDVQPVWDQGINGTGVRVGVMDSGVMLNHEALRDSYVGQYGWYAPRYFTEEPEDEDGHGTHCMGTIVGQGGIGVAPGAKWMACQNIPGGQAEDLACGEFFACPTLPDGSNPDCSKAADLVSNSWGYGGGSDFFDGVFSAWEAAGIVPIFAAGNEGPRCSSLRSPGDSSHPALITVGSTDSADRLSTFTSFGPSTLGPIKPDVAAPGTDIRSSCNRHESDYCVMSGTSMATPHVAGVVALIISAEPTSTVEEIAEMIYLGATDTVALSGRNCGDVPESTYPNNHVGHGRLSASASILQPTKLRA